MNCITRRGRGILVAFEGCDRSGKSTQCQMLVEYLKSIGRDVAHLRFPGIFNAVLATLKITKVQWNVFTLCSAVHVAILVPLIVTIIIIRFVNRGGKFLFLFMIILICLRVLFFEWSGSGSVIQDHSDHGVTKELRIHFEKGFIGSFDDAAPWLIDLNLVWRWDPPWPGQYGEGWPGPLPYVSYMYVGICRCEGYSFEAVKSGIGYGNQTSKLKLGNDIVRYWFI